MATRTKKQAPDRLPTEPTPAQNSGLADIEADELGEYAENREELLAFCYRHGLLAHLKTAVDLAKQSFQPNSLKAHLERDPETSEEWIVVRVTVPSTAPNVRAAYRHYTRQWGRSVPGPEQFLVRISYDVA